MSMRRAAPRGIGSLALAVTAMTAAQTRESGIRATTVLDNDTVRVARLHVAPGAAWKRTAAARERRAP